MFDFTSHVSQRRCAREITFHLISSQHFFFASLEVVLSCDCQVNRELFSFGNISKSDRRRIGQHGFSVTQTYQLNSKQTHLWILDALSHRVLIWEGKMYKRGKTEGQRIGKGLMLIQRSLSFPTGPTTAREISPNKTNLIPLSPMTNTQTVISTCVSNMNGLISLHKDPNTAL